MKNNFLIIIGTFILNISMFGQGIEFFHGSWKEAMAKAKAEDKLLFVDAYAVWCGPCKAMAANVFTKQKVGDFFNSNFINLKLDMEKEDGVSFGHKYPVSAYPTLMFLDGDGKVIKNIVGGQNEDGLIGHGETAMRSNDKSGKYEILYLEGDRSYDLLLNYVRALNAAGKPSLKISNEYIDSKPNITQNQMLVFLLDASVDSDSKLFDQVVEHKSKLIDLVGKETYEKKCMTACQATILKAIEYEMESLLSETLAKAKKTFPDEADVFSYKAMMQYYRSFRNGEKFESAYKSLAKKSSKNPANLTIIVNDITKYFNDRKNMIDDAAGYAIKVFELKSDMETLSLLVSTLILNKEVEKAIKIVTKEKERIEKEGGNLSNYDGMLNYLNSKKA